MTGIINFVSEDPLHVKIIFQYPGQEYDYSSFLRGKPLNLIFLGVFHEEMKLIIQGNDHLTIYLRGFFFAKFSI